ncbi:MAG: hypothetical protein AB7H43_05270 [Acidimicrobiia bacterium]
MAVDGTWNATMNTPQGAQAMTIELQSEGSTLTGTMGSAMGSMAVEAGTIDGDAVAWECKLTQPMAITLSFKGTVDGDSMSGDASFGSFGSGSFSATRA